MKRLFIQEGMLLPLAKVARIDFIPPRPFTDRGRSSGIRSESGRTGRLGWQKEESVMRLMRTVVLIGLSMLVFGAFSAARAQQPQIPTLQVCNATQVRGKAGVKIASRADASHSGSFTIVIDVQCNREENNGYPVGGFEIRHLSISD